MFSLQWTWVQSLVREQRSCKPRDMVEKRRKKVFSSCQRTKLQDCYLSAFLCSMAMECTPCFSHCLPILLKAEWVGELAWCRSTVYFLESLEIEMPSGPLMTRVERTLSTSGGQSQGLCHIKGNTLIIRNAVVFRVRRRMDNGTLFFLL